MNKLFLATWGEGYAIKESQVITLDVITEDNGWWEDNIISLSNAKVGDTVDCSDWGGELTVKRIA